MSDAHAYTEDEWREISAGRPLGGLAFMDCYLIYERWIWANRLKVAFDAVLADPDEREWTDGEPVLAHDRQLFMYLWYSLLYAVVEALVDDRGIAVSGRLATDIEYVKERLRLTRNAAFHVPRPGEIHDGFSRGGPHDERLFRLMFDPSSFREDGTFDPDAAKPDKASVGAIWRMHQGLGRLLKEESRVRNSGEGPREQRGRSG